MIDSGHAHVPELAEIAALDALRRDLPRLDAERAGEWLYGAPRLSMFDLLGDSELQLSRVYAFLLDPAEAHGQGSLYLNAFRKVIGLTPQQRSLATDISLEVSTETRRRIDILIETERDIIGIENKPYAGLQPDQLLDYHNFLGRSAKPTVLVFLSQWEPMEGERPAVDDDDKNFVCLPFAGGEQSLADCFRNVLSETKAERTRYLVEDVIKHMERRMGGIDVAPDPLTRELREGFRDGTDSEMAKIISTVIADAEFYRSELIDRIGNRIRKALPDNYSLHDWATEERLDQGMPRLSERPAGAYNGWAFRNDSWPNECWLSLIWEKGDRQHVIHGVFAAVADDTVDKNDATPAERGDLEKFLNGLDFDFERTEDWPAWNIFLNEGFTLNHLGRLAAENNGSPESEGSVDWAINQLVSMGEKLDSHSGGESVR